MFKANNVADNFKINVDTNISCKEEGHGGGKFIKGVIFKKNNNKNIVKSAKCVNLQLEQDVLDVQKGTNLDDICDCEVIMAKNNQLNCPRNKYLREYYPSLQKGLCCTPCSHNGNIKAIDKRLHCDKIYLRNSSKTALSCPAEKFVKGIDIGNPYPNINCCAPSVGGLFYIKHNEQKDKCQNLGISECNQESINNVEKMCKDLGLSQCNTDEINKMKEKCNSYGMRYYDYNTNKYHNTDSHIECHQDNVSKLDDICKKNDIKNCSWYNIHGMNTSAINLASNSINNLNKIQKIYEKKLDESKKENVNYIFVLLLLCSCILFTFIIIYIIKNKSPK